MSVYLGSSQTKIQIIYISIKYTKSYWITQVKKILISLPYVSLCSAPSGFGRKILKVGQMVDLHTPGSEQPPEKADSIFMLPKAPTVK